MVRKYNSSYTKCWCLIYSADFDQYKWRVSHCSKNFLEIVLFLHYNLQDNIRLSTPDKENKFCDKIVTLISVDLWKFLNMNKYNKV